MHSRGNKEACPYPAIKSYNMMYFLAKFSIHIPII